MSGSPDQDAKTVGRHAAVGVSGALGGVQGAIEGLGDEYIRHLNEGGEYVSEVHLFVLCVTTSLSGLFWYALYGWGVFESHGWLSHIGVILASLLILRTWYGLYSFFSIFGLAGRGVALDGVLPLVVAILVWPKLGFVAVFGVWFGTRLLVHSLFSRFEWLRTMRYQLLSAVMYVILATPPVFVLYCIARGWKAAAP